MARTESVPEVHSASVPHVGGYSASRHTQNADMLRPSPYDNLPPSSNVYALREPSAMSHLPRSGIFQDGNYPLLGHTPRSQDTRLHPTASDYIGALFCACQSKAFRA